MKVRVLFVCLGNICRSPTAEAVFAQLVDARGLSSRYEIDSAGTGSWHVGEPPDKRMRAAGKKRGLAFSSRARQVAVADFDAFDHIIAMDRENQRDLLRLARSAPHKEKVRLLREFSGDEDLDVPDPYYGGPEGFDRVIDIVEHSCRAFLDSLETA